MSTRFVILIIGSYLLGSVPVSYLAAKLLRGIDLRRYGTSQVGTGNLWRMTSAWQIGVPVGIFDLCKGAVMVLAANLVGLDIPQQIVVGLAAIIGHNWPVFLHFSGGRGIGTTAGIIIFLPIINDLTPWIIASAGVITFVGSIILRSSPLPVLVGAASIPLVTWGLGESLPVTLSFLAILLIIVVKRLTVARSVDTPSSSARQMLLNRLLFDRDITDRKLWMYRKPVKEKENSKG